jgi:glycerophosphoryl diester phosphodiesterase
MTDRFSADPSAIGRRAFLGGALATLLVGSACTSRLAGDVRVPATITSLRRDDPFYIAHRGGGGDWPEMTAYAYEQAAKVPGLKAMEVSVCLSADGVLVCSHDATTSRLTGASYTIAKETWQTLSALRVSGAETTDPTQPSQAFSRFDDIIEQVIDNFVVFVEPKATEAGDPLMARLVQLNQAPRVVWKQPINSSRFGEAKSHGFATWGYVLNEPDHLKANLTRLAASTDVDMLGAPLSESDEFIRAIVDAGRANAKPVIAQTVRTFTDRSRAVDLGCTGLMTSTIVELLRAG